MSQEFIDKLKAIGEASKSILLYLLFPVIGFIAYVFYLKNKIRDLKDDVAVSKAEKDLTESVSKLGDLTKEAQDAEDDYDSARDKLGK